MLDRAVLIRFTVGRLGGFGCAVSGGLRPVCFVNGVLPNSDGSASLLKLENFARLSAVAMTGELDRGRCALLGLDSCGRVSAAYRTIAESSIATGSR